MAESEDGHHIQIVPDDSAWAGVEDNAEDPEEVRVIFSALDSFL
jgi:carnosine N-methyltransferase